MGKLIGNPALRMNDMIPSQFIEKLPDELQDDPVTVLYQRRNTAQMIIANKKFNGYYNQLINKATKSENEIINSMPGGKKKLCKEFYDTVTDMRSIENFVCYGEGLRDGMRLVLALMDNDDIKSK